MGEVIELKARRRLKRPEPVPSFDKIMGRLFEALDLMEPVRGTEAAHKAVCDGIEMLLAREERRMTWPTK
ncbi:hypothetical protein [Rhizobium bangladeshense]|uniref:hypothetical protein n=1 Tax=Rhizobium bangladeshense TaxID=1138189 RepID=UPI0007E567A3|nr:hypothetical protein [Rhizobium bangladeshense]